MTKRAEIPRVVRPELDGRDMRTSDYWRGELYLPLSQVDSDDIWMRDATLMMAYRRGSYSEFRLTFKLSGREVEIKLGKDQVAELAEFFAAQARMM